MDDGVGESRKRKEHVRERRGLERFWRKRAPVWPPRWPRKWTQIQGRIIGQRPLCRGENQIEFVSEEFALFSFLECHPVKNLFKHSRSTRFIRDNWADPSKRNDESVSLFQIFHRPFSVRSNLIIWILGSRDKFDFKWEFIDKARKVRRGRARVVRAAKEKKREIDRSVLPRINYDANWFPATFSPQIDFPLIKPPPIRIISSLASATHRDMSLSFSLENPLLWTKRKKGGREGGREIKKKKKKKENRWMESGEMQVSARGLVE